MTSVYVSSGVTLREKLFRIMIGALIGAGMGLVSGITGAVKSAKAARQQQQLIDEQNRKNDIWFNNEYYKDYMDRSDVQAAMERVRQTMQRQNQRVEQQAAVTGATPESVIAQKEANAGVITDAAAAMQANASAHQDKVMDAYRAKQDSLAGQQQQQYQLSEQGYANLANTGFNTAANMAASAISGAVSNPQGADKVVDAAAKADPLPDKVETTTSLESTNLASNNTPSDVSKKAIKEAKKLSTNYTSVWNA